MLLSPASTPARLPNLRGAAGSAARPAGTHLCRNDTGLGCSPVWCGHKSALPAGARVEVPQRAEGSTSGYGLRSRSASRLQAAASFLCLGANCRAVRTWIASANLCFLAALLRSDLFDAMKMVLYDLVRFLLGNALPWEVCAHRLQRAPGCSLRGAGCPLRTPGWPPFPGGNTPPHAGYSLKWSARSVCGHRATPKPCGEDGAPPFKPQAHGLENSCCGCGHGLTPSHNRRSRRCRAAAGWNLWSCI